MMKGRVPFFWIATYGGLSITGAASTKEGAIAAVVGDFDLDDNQTMLLSEIDSAKAKGWKIMIHASTENVSEQQSVAA